VAQERDNSGTNKTCQLFVKFFHRLQSPYIPYELKSVIQIICTLHPKKNPGIQKK
jgi:hypothetical protein